MSSTEPSTDGQGMRRFHRETIVPAARALRRHGSRHLDTAFAADRETYFQARETTRLARADFEIRPGDVHAVLGALEERYAEEEWSIVEPVFRGILDRMPDFADAEERQTVSPSVYVMY